MSEAQQIASGNHDERMRRGVELLRRDNAMLERQVSVLREALAARALLDGPTVIRQGPVLDAIERLERENAALRKDNLKAHQMACEAGLERDRLRDELAALREAFAKADVLAEYSRFDGRREWTVVETWVYPNDIIVQMDRAAFDAARAKEGQS